MSVLSRKVLCGLVAGAAAVGVAVAQPPTEPIKTPASPGVTPSAAVDPIRAADPLGAMLADARAAYAKVRDYACVFTRQERINGALSFEQVAEMKVRAQPYSVYVRFARPEGVAGLEAAFAANRRDGKIRYKPPVKAGSSGFQTVSPEDPKMLAENRHPVNELGIGKVIDRLVAVTAREKSLNNPVEAFPSDYAFAGKQVTRYEVFTRRPHAHRYAYRYLVYVDKETKLPVRFEAYDQPKPGASPDGELLEAYSYSELRLNVGLGDSAFEY
jgi:hypothetical protein